MAARAKKTSPKSKVPNKSLKLAGIRPKFNWKFALVLAILIAIPGYILVRFSFAAGPSGNDAYETIKVPAGQEQRVAGLKKVKKEAITNPCAGAYEVDNKLDAKGQKICTSSNETLPTSTTSVAQGDKLQAEASAMAPKSSTETVATLKATGKPATNATIAQDYAAVSSASGSIAYEGASPIVPTSPGCYGTGKDGRRLVLVAAGTAAKPITPAEVASIKNIAGQMESTLIWNSYRQNPDKVMHWRFFQDADCKPIVITTTQAADYYNDLSVFTFASLKQDSGIQAAAATTRAQAAGQDLIPHYVVFTRSGGNACGQSDFAVGGGFENSEAFSFVYGATPSGKTGDRCWNGFTAQHESLHAVGAVDFSAPHTTFFGHCTDEYDIMCYNDTGGAAMTINCPMTGEEAWLHDYLMDCGADDYFSVKPNADAVFKPNFWLGGGLERYNTANSAFMTNTTGLTTANPVNVPPTVRITAPAAGSSVLSGTPVAITADATDSDGIEKVEFYNGTTKIGDDITAPYTATATNLTAGTAVILKAVATDKKGLKTTSADITVTVMNVVTPAPPVVPTTPTKDTIPPVGPAKIGLYLNFDIWNGGYAIQLNWAAATDNTRVTQYRIFRNDVELGKSSGLGYTDKAIAADRAYSYKVLSEDAAGNLSTASSISAATTRCAWIFCWLQ